MFQNGFVGQTALPLPHRFVKYISSFQFGGKGTAFATSVRQIYFVISIRWQRQCRLPYGNESVMNPFYFNAYNVYELVVIYN
jgi:hypothetical protein